MVQCLPDVLNRGSGLYFNENMFQHQYNILQGIRNVWSKIEKFLNKWVDLYGNCTNNSLGYCVLYPESTLKCNREWHKVRQWKSPKTCANACSEKVGGITHATL